LFRELTARDNYTVWCGNVDVLEMNSYGALATTEIPVSKTVVLPLLGIFRFAIELERANLLLCGECFYASNWNAEDTTVLYSLLCSALSTLRKFRKHTEGELTLLMYDGIKPISSGESTRNTAISHYYQEMLRQGDRIVFNSNTEAFGDFMDNAIPLSKPRLHLYRYTEQPLAPKPRLGRGDDGTDIHMVSITVSLGEFSESSREQSSMYVRAVIQQRIHFHYYCNPNDPTILKFREALAPEFRKYLHLHKLNMDQAELVTDLQQYHVGFNPSDHVPFARGISTVNNRFYQDAMLMFLQSTVGTSFLVYAAAGLPVILPRGCTSATQLLGDGAIPILFSEMHHMRTVLERADLDRRLAAAEAQKDRFCMPYHADKFVEFFRT
jgi:hypothetical protein